MAATSPHPIDTRRLNRAMPALITLACLLIAPINSALALESDARAPIEVEADSTEFDNQSQRHTLRGDVRVRQGTMSINAERIVLQLADGKLLELNAQGKPLSFSVQDDTGATVTAEAEQIIYKPGDSQLSLLGDARLLSGGRELSGERIDYDISKANVQALSGNDNRVRVTIDPNVEPNAGSGN